MVLLVAMGVVGLAVVSLLAWILTVRLRRATHARRHSGAWDAFASTCPEPPPGPDGHAHPLTPHPGPAGEVVVRPDGLCLTLSDHPGQTLWLPWASVRWLNPAEPSGVDVGISGGLRFQVSAHAGRAIWESRVANLHSGAPPKAPTLAPAAG